MAAIVNKRPPRLLLRENPLGSFHRGGTFFFLKCASAIHLSGMPHDAMEKTFNGGRRVEVNSECSSKSMKTRFVVSAQPEASPYQKQGRARRPAEPPRMNRK